MLKNYKISFDIWALLLFLIIMVPNFIWFVIPAPNDILRTNSVTETLDLLASVCQIVMIIALGIFRNQKRKELKIMPFIVVVMICCILYFASWGAYYIGIVNVAVILGMTIPPCLAFLFFAIGRRNIIAVVPISIFLICHLIYATVNFII
jgi:hypothetical protein